MQVFQAMGTQWRMGFNGPVGLDYNVLPLLIKAVFGLDNAALLADR